MPRFRFRFGLRGTMVAIALVGLACRGTSLYQQRQKYLERADYFGDHEAMYATLLADGPVVECSQGLVGRSPEELAVHDAIARAEWRKWETEERALLEHFRMLKKKYERAARYPWLWVEPDPPEPE